MAVGADTSPLNPLGLTRARGTLIVLLLSLPAMEAVSELTQEKTVIMIAHRLKTVHQANQILVVDKRQIVQRGTHEELMAQDGIYRHFISGREQAVGWKL